VHVNFGRIEPFFANAQKHADRSNYFAFATFFLAVFLAAVFFADFLATFFAARFLAVFFGAETVEDFGATFLAGFLAVFLTALS
jgi:hypothetical protein